MTKPHMASSCVVATAPPRAAWTAACRASAVIRLFEQTSLTALLQSLANGVLCPYRECANGQR